MAKILHPTQAVERCPLRFPPDRDTLSTFSKYLRGNNGDGNTVFPAVARPPLLLSRRNAATRVACAGSTKAAGQPPDATCAGRQSSSQTGSQARGQARRKRRRASPAARAAPTAARRTSQTCDDAPRTDTHKAQATALASTGTPAARETRDKTTHNPASIVSPGPRPSAAFSPATVGTSATFPAFLFLPPRGPQPSALVLRSPAPRHQPCEPPGIRGRRLLPLRRYRLSATRSPRRIRLSAPAPTRLPDGLLRRLRRRL
jgi:hypothetical protein